MRLNVRKTLEAVAQGKRYGKFGSSIWTDGVDVYSYFTPILVKTGLGNYVLNNTTYSRTTSSQQHSIAAWGRIKFNLEIHPLSVEGMKRGCSREDILQAHSDMMYHTLIGG